MSNKFAEKINFYTENPYKFKDYLQDLSDKIPAYNSELNCILRSYVPSGNLAQIFPEILRQKQGKKLFGSTFVVKDSFFVQGQPLSFGLKPEVINSAPKHADFVRLLIDHGSSLIASTNLDPCALSASGENSNYGRVLNYLYKDKISGGSSSGSAVAVSADLADFAVGSDLAGSVRLPASFSGLASIKFKSATFSKAGSYLLDSSYDSIGLITKDYADLMYLCSALGQSNECVDFHADKIYKIYLPKEDIEKYLASELALSFNSYVSKLSEKHEILDLGECNYFKEAGELLKYGIASVILKDERYLRINQKPDTLLALLEFAKSISVNKLQEIEERIKYITEKIFNLLSENSVILTPSILDLPPSYKNFLKNPACLDDISYFLKLANLCDLTAVTYALPAKAGEFPCSVQMLWNAD